MLKKYDITDPAGRELLHGALTRQGLFSGVRPEVIAAAVEQVVLEEHKDGAVLIEQGHTSTELFLILSGQVEVTVAERHVAFRERDEHVGEMAALEPEAPRCATVKAKGLTVTARLSERQLRALAKEDSQVWRNIARVLSHRLRSRQVRPRNVRANVFVGSTSEGLAVPRQLVRLFEHSPFSVRQWTNGVFRPSSVTMDELLRVADESDFAVLSFGEEDTTTSRRKRTPAPRDNVVLEYGLFAGALGDRQRVFILKPRGSTLKIPSDIQGLTPLTYDASKPLDIALDPVAIQIAEAVARLGPR